MTSFHKTQNPCTNAVILVTVATVLLLSGLTLVNFVGPIEQASSRTARFHPHVRPSHSTPGSLASINMSSAWMVERPRVILFGDSLTERSLSMGGWGSSLAHTYYRKVDVINRGFGGYNTGWALHLMDEIFKGCNDKNTALVTLFFGANDAAIPLPDGTEHSARQHVPVSEFRENMKRIIAALKERGLQRLVVITPPPVYEPGRKEAQRLRIGVAEAETMPLDRTNIYTKQYAVACQEVAAAEGLPVVDLWSSMQVDQDWGTKLFNDGLHFTIEGNQHAYEAVQRTINETYPTLRVEALPLHFPAWDAIDPKDPAASLKLPEA